MAMKPDQTPLPVSVSGLETLIAKWNTTASAQLRDCGDCADDLAALLTRENLNENAISSGPISTLEPR